MKTLLLPALALGALLTVTGCSAPEDNDLSLAETKSPAQLLRNEIFTRVPKADIAAVTTDDFTEGCNGDEAVRSWRSTANAELNASSATSFASVVRALRVSFEDKGWMWEPSPGTDELQGVLSNEKTPAQIYFSATPPAGGSNAALLVVVGGPCVETDGPDSPEVLKLENREA